MAEVRRASHRVLGSLQHSVTNPVVRVAWKLEIPIPGDGPAGDYLVAHRAAAVDSRVRRLDDETFGLVAWRGRSAGWVRNIEADPRVRVRVSGLRTSVGSATSADSFTTDRRSPYRWTASQAGLWPRWLRRADASPACIVASGSDRVKGQGPCDRQHRSLVHRLDCPVFSALLPGQRTDGRIRRCLVRSAVGPGRAVQIRHRSARTTSLPRA